MKEVNLTEYAVELGQGGWRVLPLRAGGKVPVLADWPEAASADEETIRQWFGKYKSANIGIALGRGQLVIDTDKKHNGETRLQELEAKLGPLPQTVMVKTGSGGFHRYFTYPTETKVGNRASLNGPGQPGVDIRAEGGQVVAPPSVNGGGRAYEWYGDCPIAPLPQKWLDFIADSVSASENAVPATTDGDRRQLTWKTTRFCAEGVADGDRNHSLYSAACDFNGCGYSIEEARPRLLVGASACRPAMDTAEANATIESAYRGEKLPGNRDAKVVDSRNLPKTTEINQESLEEPHENDENPFSAFKMPVPMSKLAAGVPLDFLWHGYLAKRHSTLVVGLPKAGKSTLLGHLFRAFEVGGDLAGSVKPCRALVISEESEDLWKGRREEIGIGDHIHVICRPFKMKPEWRTWELYLSFITKLCKDNLYDVVIFDTISGFIPIDNENDSAQMLRAMMPLNGLLEAQVAVLMIHHPRKGDGAAGTASRGSSALPGFADILVEFRHYAAEDNHDRRRTVIGRSRYSATPLSQVIELTDKGYRKVGDIRDAKKMDRLDAYSNIVPKSGDAWGVHEIHANWPDDCKVPRPGKRTIECDMEDAVRYEFLKLVSTRVGNVGAKYHSI